MIATVYQFPGRPLSAEFHSLSLGTFSALRDDGTRWQPKDAGVTFQPVPNTSPPAEATVGRRIQMRAIVQRFAADRTEPNGVNYQLRLLPRPLFRYGKDGSSISEGAIFTFVQGTNPDVLLLLEARRQPAGYRWEYALARLHHRTMRASFDEKTVWRVAQLSNSEKEDRRASYTIFRRSAVCLRQACET